MGKPARADDLGALILTIRGHRVMVDADLARLYGVSTKVLNQAVKRNAERFPDAFAFRLSKAEKAKVVTDCDHLKNLKFSPVQPLVFTEHGALMAANVLNSPAAIEMSVKIVTAFVRLRQLAMSIEEVARRLEKLESTDAEKDEHLRRIYLALQALMAPPPEGPKRRIGFRGGEE